MMSLRIHQQPKIHLGILMHNLIWERLYYKISDCKRYTKNAHSKLTNKPTKSELLPIVCVDKCIEADRWQSSTTQMYTISQVF